MANSGDKFGSLMLAERTVEQEEKFQCCPYFKESSETQSSAEQPTGIQMVSLPDSFDEYQTPPEQPYSQNSNNAAPAGEPRVVDLADVSDNLDTEPMDVDNDDERVAAEGVDTEVIVSSGEENAHQVLDEMPKREQEIGKRKLPAVMRPNTGTGSFKDTLSRVMKMVGEGKTKPRDEDGDVDFLEIAMRRGMTFPRPRWWPAEGFKDSSS